MTVEVIESMLWQLVAALSAGLFAGATAYRNSLEAAALLTRWGRLHLIRTLASTFAFAVMLAHIVGAV